MNTVARAVFALVLLTVCGSQSYAQQDPRQILSGVIYQLQTGTPNRNWYGFQLWNTIAMQTGNTGVYPALRQLGVVRGVDVLEQVQLPAGPVYALMAQHQFGVSGWHLGIVMQTNRIEYAFFNIGGPPPPLPSGSPVPAPRPVPPPSPSPRPQPPTPDPGPPDGTSEACKKFPNLC